MLTKKHFKLQKPSSKMDNTQPIEKKFIFLVKTFNYNLPHR